MSAIAEREAAAPLRPFLHLGVAGRSLALLLSLVDHLTAALLAVDVAVVFLSVVCRYLLHSPLDWAEEVASALMVTQVFLGAAAMVGHGRHAGVDASRWLFPAAWHPYLVQLAAWAVAATAAALFASALALYGDSEGQTTPFGLPGWIFVDPVIAGSALMTLMGLAVAVTGPPRIVWSTALGAVLTASLLGAWLWLAPASAPSPFALLGLSFLGSLAIGVPIAFALALGALAYFLAEPSLPLSIYSQQVEAGAEHFVLLAIPFFVLAGLAMEANGMSARLVELLVRLMGRLRGGMNLITIVATALFSGISGSKLADVAAVGSIVMPAVRRTGQDPNEAAGLLACSAVMAETIPPCVNLIIFGFVANVSIGGLFMAGIVPALVLALALSGVAVAFGVRIDPRKAFPRRTPMPRLVAGALVALAMVAMIGRGVTSGIATSTEISAFAVVYALVIGGLAFRELTWRSTVRLFVQSAGMASGILFIVAAASAFAFALTIQQIPQALSDSLTVFGQAHGSTAFVVAAALLMIGFGSVLEGAPALIIWGPLLTPIAQALGVDPLHFGTVMVIAMGIGLFAPPVGLGLCATCAMTGTEVFAVARPMVKYLAVLVAGLLLLIFVPQFSLWLPRLAGF